MNEFQFEVKKPGKYNVTLIPVEKENTNQGFSVKVSPVEHETVMPSCHLAPMKKGSGCIIGRAIVPVVV